MGKWRKWRNPLCQVYLGWYKNPMLISNNYQISDTPHDVNTGMHEIDNRVRKRLLSRAWTGARRSQKARLCSGEIA